MNASEVKFYGLNSSTLDRAGFGIIIMTDKTGRNDPCPCGSGKKYKQCCWNKRLPLGKRKFKATVVSSGGSAGLVKKAPDLMERTFGNAIRAGQTEEKPPAPPSKGQTEEKPPTPPSTDEKDLPEELKETS